MNDSKVREIRYEAGRFWLAMALEEMQRWIRAEERAASIEQLKTEYAKGLESSAKMLRQILQGAKPVNIRSALPREFLPVVNFKKLGSETKVVRGFLYDLVDVERAKGSEGDPWRGYVVRLSAPTNAVQNGQIVEVLEGRDVIVPASPSSPMPAVDPAEVAEVAILGEMEGPIVKMRIKSTGVTKPRSDFPAPEHLLVPRRCRFCEKECVPGQRVCPKHLASYRRRAKHARAAKAKTVAAGKKR